MIIDGQNLKNQEDFDRVGPEVEQSVFQKRTDSYRFSKYAIDPQ